MASSTWLGVERRGGAGGAAGHAEAPPVELGHQRLAVDVQARERHQVGEPPIGVPDDLDVRHRRRDPLADPRDQGVLAGATVARARRRPPGGRRRPPGRPGRSRSRSCARRPGRRPGTGCATATPACTSSTPTPAGPPHLCADAAAAAQPSGSGSRPADGAGVGEDGDVAAPRRPRRRAGRCRPRGWPPGRRPRRPAPATGVRRPPGPRGRPGRAGRRRRSPGGAPTQSSGVPDGRVLHGGERHGHAATGGAPVQPEQAPVDGVGPRGGEADLVGPGRPGRGRRPPGRCPGAAGRERPGRCSRRGSAYPRSRALWRTSSAAGWSGSEDAASRSQNGA